MKASNANQPGERSHGINRGHTGLRAGSSGITVTDGVTTVKKTVKVMHRGASVARLGSGYAEVTQTGIGQFVDNGEVDTLLAGEVVVLDAATNTVIRTTTPQDTRPVGVVQRDMLTGEAGPVIFSGFVSLVLVTASVTAGNYAETSSTGGQATENPTIRSGSFGTFLTDGTTPSAYLFGAAATSSPTGGGGTLDWFIVTDYGAAGDGTTDDTAAIQAAIDAICSTGEFGTLYFPIGTYKITATLTLGCSIRLLGAGGYPGVASIISMATNNTTAIAQSAADYLTIDNLSVRNAGTSASGRGVYALGPVAMNHSEIRGFHDNLYIDSDAGGSYFSLIDESWFISAAGAGLYLKGAVNNIRVNGSRFASNAKGIYAIGAGAGAIVGATISDCDFENNTSAGIEWDGAASGFVGSTLRISGGWFDANGPAHISIGPTNLVRAVMVEDCYFEINAPGTENALKANRCDRLTVIGCEFRATSGATSILCDLTNTTNVVLINVKAADTVTLPATSVVFSPDGVPGGELGGTWASPTVDGTHSGSPHSDYIAKAFFAAKGDLIGASANDTPSLVPVGSDGYLLTADSTATAGVAWVAPAAAAASAMDHLHIGNLLFSGDGATVAFELPAAPFDDQSLVVWVSGTLTAVTLSGSLLTTMTFGSAPAAATDNIRVDLVAAAA